MLYESVLFIIAFSQVVDNLSILSLAFIFNDQNNIFTEFYLTSFELFFLAEKFI